MRMPDFCVPFLQLPRCKNEQYKLPEKELLCEELHAAVLFLCESDCNR